MQFTQIDRLGSGQAVFAWESHEQLVLAQHGRRDTVGRRQTGRVVADDGQVQRPAPEVVGLASRKNFGRLEHTFLPRKAADVQEKHNGLRVATYLGAIACLATGASCCWSSWTGCCSG